MPSDEIKKKRRGERLDGRILVTLAIGVDENGKTVRKYFYGATREEANAKRDRYRQDRELGMSAYSDKITVEEWINIWVNKYKNGLEVTSFKNYNAHINRLNKRIGSRLLKSISEVDLQSALFEIANTSSSNIEKYHSFIRQVFGKALRNRLIHYDPSADLMIPHGYKGTHRSLERWEINAILQHYDAHRSGLWAMLMMLAGLRRGEMMALQWSDIDLDHRQIYIHQSVVMEGNSASIRDRTKSSSGKRILPICGPLFDCLCRVDPSERYGYVCVSARGKPLTSSAFSRGWDGFNLSMTRILNNEPPIQQGRRYDLEDKKERPKIVFSIRSHDLRHTFATALYDAGISVKAAQYYLGHADMRMTLDLYTHLSTEREKHERIELTSFLDSWLPTPENFPALFQDNSKRHNTP